MSDPIQEPAAPNKQEIKEKKKVKEKWTKHT
jgi:hypothetical protein